MINERDKIFGDCIITINNYLHIQWIKNENNLWDRRDGTIKNKTTIEAFSIQSGADFCLL